MQSLQVRVQPFPLSIPAAACEGRARLIGANAISTPAAGAVAGLIDNFVWEGHSDEGQNWRHFPIAANWGHDAADRRQSGGRA
jgi:hypothetical protein